MIFWPETLHSKSRFLNRHNIHLLQHTHTLSLPLSLLYRLIVAAWTNPHLLLNTLKALSHSISLSPNTHFEVNRATPSSSFSSFSLDFLLATLWSQFDHTPSLLGRAGWLSPVWPDLAKCYHFCKKNIWQFSRCLFSNWQFFDPD